MLQDSKINITNNNNHFILIASLNGHIEIVKLLLQDSRVDLIVDLSHIITKNSINNYNEIVELLFEDPRVHAYLAAREKSN